jgi:phosphatidylinositol alpha-1,6-mannosyltransferase
MTAPESTPQKKRIVGLFPELLGVGGVQEAGRQTAAAIERIALRNGGSSYFLSLNDPSGGSSLHAGDNEIPFLGFGRAKLNFILAAIDAARKGVDIVLALHSHLAPVATCMKLASQRRVHTIVISHGVEVWQRLSLIRRYAVSHADRVVAPSSDTMEKLAAVQGVAQRKLRKLAWPLSPKFLALADSPVTLPESPQLPQGQIILTVGRWSASERYKGADELIGAVAQLCPAFAGLHLVAVGGGDDLPRLRALASELGIAGRVHFFDSLSREEVASCYARAYIFALPSTGEGYGMVFLEAMAFGLPIVAAACGGSTDLVLDESNGSLVAPNDVGELARALERLLKDDSLRLRLGRCGAETVRQQYRFEIFEASLERILGECGMDSRPQA